MPDDGTTNLRPGEGYILFSNAERLHMTVAKMLTGHDMPISNLEIVLTDTYQRAKERFRIQHERAYGKGKKR